MANKLYELLAVEQDRKHKATQAVGEALKIFQKQDALFDGMTKRYVAIQEDSDQIPDEVKEMHATVKEKLNATLEAVITGIDAHLSKEETNAAGVAKAELQVDGTNFGTYSATSLLALEGRLQRLKELYQSLPVLDATKKWTLDSHKGVFKTEEEVKFRSVKRPQVIVKYEATKEHPAQTELLYLDFQVGKYETIYTSGKITPAQKQTLLQRLDTLLEAVKVARAKANNVEVQNTQVGKKIFDFINAGIF